MPGKRGRSKACATCRQRRIGCDLKEPSCSQCKKSGLECPGYATGPVFVFHNPGSKRRPSRDSAKQASDPCESDGTVSPGSDVILFNGAIKPLSPPRELVPLAGFRREIFHQYFETSYPVMDLDSNDYPRPWFTFWPDHPQPTNTLETAMTAFVASSLGRERHDDWLTAQGDRLYGAALVELRAALANPATARDEQTLCACMALLHNEVLACPGGTRAGYNSHRAGASQLIRLRKPRDYSAPFLHEIFQTFRILEMLYALENLTPSFLSEPAWTKLPWTGLVKSSYDRIVDRFFEISTLFGELRGCFDLPVLAQAPALEDLSARYAAIADALHHELTTTIAARCPGGGPICWTVPSQRPGPLDPATGEGLFPTVFEFPDQSIARDAMMVWTGQAVASSARAGNWLRMAGLAAHGVPGAAEVEARSGGGDAVLAAWREAVHNACRCCEYCMRPPMSTITKMMLIIPVQILAGIVRLDPRFERELAWVEDLGRALVNDGMRLLQWTVTS